MWRGCRCIRGGGGGIGELEGEREEDRGERGSGWIAGGGFVLPPVGVGGMLG